MTILNNFEKHQITRTLVADYNGSNYPHTFNYLNDLIFFKHVCNCDGCKTLTRNLTCSRYRFNPILFLLQSNIIPLAINQEISYILAEFEGYHALNIPNI